MYDAIVSIDTYTNRIKEIDRTRCSIEFPGMTNPVSASGTRTKYRGGEKSKLLRLCEKVMKK
jgi:hypothetical protein